MKPVGEPDAGNLHVRFDERGRETERLPYGSSYRARPRLYPASGEREFTAIAAPPVTAFPETAIGLPIRARLIRGFENLRQEWLRGIILGAAVVIVGWLVFYPLGILFDIGLRAEDGSLTLTNYRSVFSEPGLVSALINSIVISVATTALSLVLALPMAWAVARVDMPGRQFVRVAALVAFVIPNFISVIAWILLLGPNAGLINVLIRDALGIVSAFNIYSIGGLILVLTLSFYPLIFFAVAAALDNMDPAYEEAAQMVGAPAWRSSIGIALPLVLPALVSSSVFVFLEAMGAFGAPAAIGHGAHFHTLTTKIYELFSYPPRFELAAAAAAPIIGFTILGLMLQRQALGGRRFTVIGGKRSAARAVDIGWRRWLLFGYCMLVIFASVVLPLLILLRTSVLSRWGLALTWQNLTFKNYLAFATPSMIVPTALLNSMIVSAPPTAFPSPSCSCARASSSCRPTLRRPRGSRAPPGRARSSTLPRPSLRPGSSPPG